MARFYDPQLARFISADTLVPEPGNLKSYDRYGYVNNNPIRFNDPSGHRHACADGDWGGGCGSESTAKTYLGAINAWFSNVSIVKPKSWTATQLKTLIGGLFIASAIHSGVSEFSRDLGNFRVMQTSNPKISGMVIPLTAKPTMILNKSYLDANNRDSVETILHETGHVFDFKGDKNKSNDFIKAFSPGSSCQSALLGCLNQKTINYRETMQFYGGINITIYGTPNIGYDPNISETTKYGAIGTMDDWAETYIVLGLEKANFVLLGDQMNISSERREIIQNWINK